MKAVLIDRITKAEDAEIHEVPVPKVCPGWVLIKVKGFGLNHSEQILRLSEIEADYIQKPVIPGIECVGIVEDPSDTQFKKGDKVAALMGGMGRSFNGGYAEYALLPAHHVFHADTELSWKELAAVPETYYTAWGSLFESLQLQKEDCLLIRGATCALGYAALQLAKAYGCKVIATTHRESKMDLIREADEVVLDDGKLYGKVKGVTKALELVGPKTLQDTMYCVEKGGIVCNTGILGNVFTIANFNPIQAIPNRVYLTGFHSNWPTVQNMKDIFAFIKEHHLVPKIGASYDFDHIKDALSAQDYGHVNGKIVVTMEEEENV